MNELHNIAIRINNYIYIYNLATLPCFKLLCKYHDFEKIFPHNLVTWAHFSHKNPLSCFRLFLLLDPSPTHMGYNSLSPTFNLLVTKTKRAI